MANRFYGIIIAIAVVALIAWNSIFVVNEKEQAVVLRFGEIQRVVDKPGLYFKWPAGFLGADNVRMLPDRLLRFDLDNIRVQVSGGKFYEVDAFMVYNISDAAKFMKTVSGSIPQAEQRLRTRLDASLRRVYGLRGFEAALSDERADMMREVRDQIRPDATMLGIDLTDVRILRTDLTKEVSQQTYERMQAERLAEAERLRARGKVAAQQIKAGADREVVETKAAAQRDAEVLQGEGDAERNRVFAKAYGKDPKFFDFYRSMQAYRQALQNTGTTLVLSPNSEFFRYFRNENGEQTANVAGTAAPAAPAVPQSGVPQNGGAAASPTATPPEASAAPSGGSVPNGVVVPGAGAAATGTANASGAAANGAAASGAGGTTAGSPAGGSSLSELESGRSGARNPSAAQ